MKQSTLGLLGLLSIGALGVGSVQAGENFTWLECTSPSDASVKADIVTIARKQVIQFNTALNFKDGSLDEATYELNQAQDVCEYGKGCEFSNDVTLDSKDGVSTLSVISPSQYFYHEREFTVQVKNAGALLASIPLNCKMKATKTMLGFRYVQSFKEIHGERQTDFAQTIEDVMALNTVYEDIKAEKVGDKTDKKQVILDENKPFIEKKVLSSQASGLVGCKGDVAQEGGKGKGSTIVCMKPDFDIERIKRARVKFFFPRGHEAWDGCAAYDGDLRTGKSYRVSGGGRGSIGRSSGVHISRPSKPSGK